MKHLKSFNQLMITLGMYKSFQTAPAVEREIVPLLALLALFKMINSLWYQLQVARKGKQHQSRIYIRTSFFTLYRNETLWV